MKFKFIFYLTICILTSCNAQQQDTKLISKTFPKFGITISLPQDWGYVDGSENMKNKLFKSFYREPENKTPYNTIAASISYEVMKTKSPVDTLFNQIKKTLINQVENKEVKDYPVDKIQGRPTKAFIFNFSINEFKLTSIDIYFIEQNVLFCFKASVYADKFENYKNTINAISTSIQIGKLDPSLFTDSYEFKKIESRYVNTQYGFSVDLPIGWYYLEGIMGNAVQVKKANQDTSETISMGVNIQEDYDSKMTSEQYNKSVVRVVKKQLLVADSEEKINSTKFSHPSFEVYKAHFIAYFNNKKQIVFLYTTIKDKKGYLFVATTDEKHLADNEKLFDKTFKSMTIK